MPSQIKVVLSNGNIQVTTIPDPLVQVFTPEQYAIRVDNIRKRAAADPADLSSAQAVLTQGQATADAFRQAEADAEAARVAQEAKDNKDALDALAAANAAPAAIV